MTRTPLACAAIVCAALAGCSEPTASPPPESALARRVALEFARSEWRAPHGRVISLPADASDWVLAASECELVPASASLDDAPKLRVLAAGEAQIAVPLPPELGKFESLALRIWSAPAVLDSLRIAARCEPRSLVVSPSAAGRGWRLFHADLAALGGATSAEKLTLTLEGDLSEGVMLDAPVLEWRPPEEWHEFLASSANAPVGVRLGDEWRAAQCLRPGFVARAQLPSVESGAVLAFGFGAFGATSGNPGRATIQVTLLTDQLSVSISNFALESPDRWFDARVELPASARGHELQIELVLEKPGWLAVALDQPQVFVPQRDAPLVLLVTSDTHRGDHLGAARMGVELDTPALDALAARGLLFSNCFATSNVTLPSHVALLTGVHPLDSGVTDNNTQLDDAAPTLAEAFRDAGWHTLALTSLNLLSAGFAGLGQGFDRMSWPERRRSADATVELAREWLAQADGRPSFVWLHVFEAHTPYEPPLELARKYYAEDRDPFDAALAPDAEWRPPAWLESVRDPEYLRALYKGEITALDRALGRLFDEPRARAGVVAFTGDHGEVLGAHGIWWEHKSVYPDTLHVPLILCAPGLAAGERNSEPVLNSDLGRTLLDLAGLRASAFPGRSLVDARVSEPRFSLAGHRQSASIDFEGWHLILHLDELAEGRRTGRGRHQVELYHVADDPRCERDLVDQQVERARELRSYLARWLGEWNGGRWAGRVHTDAATLRELAALGYASADGSDPGARLLDPQCACSWCARWR